MNIKNIILYSVLSIIIVITLSLSVSAEMVEETTDLPLPNNQNYNNAVGYQYIVGDNDLILTSVKKANNELGDILTIWKNNSNTIYYQGTGFTDNIHILTNNITLNASESYGITIHKSGCVNRQNAHQLPLSISFPYNTDYGSFPNSVILVGCDGDDWIYYTTDAYSIISFNITIDTSITPKLTLSTDIINNTYTNNDYLDYEISGIYSDTTSLFNCSFYIDDTLNNTDELDFNNTYNYRLDFNDYEGIKKIRVNCSNIDISDDTNTYIINVDNIIPKINTDLINSSEIMQYEYNQFNTTFNDTNLFNYSIKLYNINDEIKTSVYAENVSSFAYNYTNYYLETLGEYYYIITAYDTYNNSNTIYRYYEVISESAYNTELIEDLLENNITIKDVLIMIPYIILLIVSLIIFVFSNDIRLDFLNTIIQIVMLLYFFTNNYDEVGYIVIAMIILQFIKIYQSNHKD